MFFLFQLGMNFETARSQSSILHAFPFNSEKKRGGVAVKTVNVCSLKCRYYVFLGYKISFLDLFLS